MALWKLAWKVEWEEVPDRKINEEDLGMKPTPEEIKQIAIECGANFYAKDIQEFFTRAYELGRKMQRESDALLVKRHPDAQLATLGDWTLTVATVLEEAIRNNTGE